MAYSNKEELLAAIKNGYRSSYDLSENLNILISEDENCNLMCSDKAAMHVSESGYVLVRKASMWAADSDEYVYFFIADSIKNKLAEKAIEYAYESTMELVDVENKKNHMCTRAVAVIITDSADEAAVKTVKKSNIYKNFNFGLKGWLQVDTVIVDFGKKSVASNRYGTATAKFIDSVLTPKNKKRSGIKKKLSLIKDMLD